ncbi:MULTISPECIES: septal ring lytic transglycosylase RlpA family protein [unclassified Bartonella]|uniref:septal ring lytic transglycosylase RlpA family protein n=1 Tax=unclassified Bartonella TaxID=2645622 RepID=UPI00099AE093|nr:MULTISPECIES: septal ring lytic transglycosylase RlpA family protein [unclassified Bartonella]AQX28012.1 rare lipoprotein A [Bartonella sp. JB15]AQX29288.1 rare lipoprotein A [Bartonella sp. JB63]
MLLDIKEKFAFITKLTSQFIFIIAATQLLTACANQITQFSVKNFDTTSVDNDKVFKRVVKAKAVSVPERILNEQNKSKNRVAKRIVIGKPYQIKGKCYYPKADPTYQRIGQASWYGSYFHGRLTANGEVYNMNLLTAAHPTLPLPSYARVTNLKNGSSIIVRVNDRGPYINNRIIDLSKQAATMLGYLNQGIADVKVEYVAEAPINNYDGEYLMASYKPGNYSPSMMMALSDTTEVKKDNAFFALNTNNYNTNNQKQPNKTTLIQLPQIGPVLIEKPASFYQMASIKSRPNKPNDIKLSYNLKPFY